MTMMIIVTVKAAKKVPGQYIQEERGSCLRKGEGQLGLLPPGWKERRRRGRVVFCSLPE